MDGYNETEVIAHEYAKNSGFIVVVPRKKDRLGYDFELGLWFEGEYYTQKVEVKNPNESLLEPQLKVFQNGGIIALVNKNTKEVKLITIEDVQEVKERKPEITRRFALKLRI